MSWLLIVVAVLGGPTIVACGPSNESSSSDPGTSSAASGSYPQGVKYSDCMRSHGVSNFPDPSPGGGFNIRGLGAETDSPAFTSAQNACASLQPGGAPPRITGAELYQMAAKATCIRQHGFPSFPDPTLVGGGDGVDDHLPADWNPEAPAAITARKACARVGIAIPGAGAAWFGPVG